MKIDLMRLRKEELYRREVCNALLNKYETEILRFCVMEVGEDHSNDVVQEVWVAVQHGLPRLRHTTNIRAWLYSIARHKCQRERKYQALWWKYSELIRRDIQRDMYHNVVSQQEERTEAEAAEKIINSFVRLRRSDQELLNMKYRAELSNDEIAIILNIKNNTVSQRISRALIRLKKVINDGL